MIFNTLLFNEKVYMPSLIAFIFAFPDNKNKLIKAKPYALIII
jgi:hypothetical protein